MRKLLLVLLVLIRLPGWAQGVATLADLKLRVGAPGQCIEMRGLLTAGDGGGGYYCWDAHSTDPPNDRTVIQVTGQTIGRWKSPMQAVGTTPLATTAVTTTISETTLVTTTLKGGMMGSGRGVQFVLICEYTTGALTIPTLTINVKLGNGTIALSGNSLTASVTGKTLVVRGRIVNATAASQYGYAEVLQYNGTGQASSAATSVDTTVDQAFSITATFSVATATATLNPKIMSINLL